MPMFCNNFELEESRDDFLLRAEPPEAFALYPSSNPGPPGPGVPAGGTAGQLLVKASDEDYDTEWIDPPDQPEMDAGHVSYDPTETYDDGTVGKELGTINSALTSLSSVTEIIDTASGAIASFPDGAGLPMRSLVAQINPVQDLHGYDAPWAAGAGKNKVPLTVDGIKSANSQRTWDGNSTTISGVTYTILTDANGVVTGVQANGTATANTSLYIFGNTTLSYGGYILNGGIAGGSSSTYYIEYYDNTVGQNYRNYSDGDLTLSADTNGHECRLVVAVRNGATVSNIVFKPMIRASGTTATFEPYSNVCPITGWTGLSGGVFDVNLLNQDGTNTNNGYVSHAYLNIHEGAVVTAEGTWDVMEYVPVKPNTTYTLSGTTANSSNGWAEYDINKVQVAHGMVSVSPFTFTTGANTYFVRFNRNYATDTQCQINLGSSALSYVPYTSLPITVSWQSEAGTVYDGYIDVVSGELVATHKSDSKTDAWSQAGNGAFYLDGKATDGDAGTMNTEADVWCNIYPRGVVGGSTAGAVDHPKTLCTQSLNGIRFMVYDTSWGGVANFNAYVAQNPMQIVYKLAQPLVYHLSPQQISTLLGNNTVFVDTGDVSVTYQASIKGYIDKVLAS